MKFRKGYKYQLAEDYTYADVIRIVPMTDIKIEFIRLDMDGVLTIKAGYAWDGASGPTVDTKNSIRGSLVHDVYYQLIRQKHLHQGLREKADLVFRSILLRDGMSRFRAWVWYRSVSKHAGSAADPKNVKKVYEAP